jgi:hypothetical protein
MADDRAWCARLSYSVSVSKWGTFRDWHRDPEFWRDLYLRTVSGLAIAGVLVGVAGITGLIPRRSALFAGAIVVFGVPLVRAVRYLARVAGSQIRRGFHHGSKAETAAAVAIVEGAALILAMVVAEIASIYGVGPTAALLILVSGMFVAPAVVLIGLQLRRPRDAAWN